MSDQSRRQEDRVEPGDELLDLDGIDAVFAEAAEVPASTSWSDLEPGRRARDLEWASQIVEHCEVIAEYIADEAARTDRQRQDAIEMRFVKIRHAAKSLSPAFRAECGIDGLAAMIGMTDRIAHDYLRVDHDIVWNAATQHVPRLRDAFEQIVQRARP